MNHNSYIRANINSIHKDWIETLRELKGLTDATARSINIEHLADLYERAKAIGEQPDLYAEQLGMLNHIIDRPLAEHLLAIKRSQPKNIL